MLWTKGVRGWLLVMCSLGLSCAHYPLQKPKFPDEGVSSTPPFVVHEVGQMDQKDSYSCATTSLAMAILYHNKALEGQLTKDVAWKISESDETKVHTVGNDMDALLRLAHHYGFDGEYADRLSIPEVEYLVSRHIFVVLNIRAQDTGDATHAVLLTGYDKAKQVLFVRDPAGLLDVVPYEVLERRWSASLSSPRGLSTRSGFLLYPR